MQVSDSMVTLYRDGEQIRVAPSRVRRYQQQGWSQDDEVRAVLKPRAIIVDEPEQEQEQEPTNTED